MLQLPIFIAQRLAKDKYQQTGKQEKSPLLRLSLIAVVLSLSVMLISTAIIVGFKKEVSRFAYSQTGHLNLHEPNLSWLSNSSYTYLTPTLCQELQKIEHCQAVYPIIRDMALLKTEDNFLGIHIYGVPENFDLSFYSQRMTEGYFPTFSEADSVKKAMVLPDKVAQTMNCKIGDKLKFYFIKGEDMNSAIQLRTYTLVGTYQSVGLDQLPALCSLGSLQKLKKLPPDYYSMAMVMLEDRAYSNDYINNVLELSRAQADIFQGTKFDIQKGEDILIDLFYWLDSLDINVYLILSLMIIICIFSMLTGLIIIVLDKRQEIGILKALGIRNLDLRLGVTLLASRLMLKGVAIANLIALAFIFAQEHFQFIKLKAEHYYMDAVPVRFEWSYWLWLNISSIVLIMLVMLLSSSLLAHIKPSEVIKEE